VRQDHAGSSVDIVAGMFLGSGWRLGQPGGYRPELAVDTAELYTFLGATQARRWERLIAGYDDADVAQRRFARRVAAELDRRGTLDVLRRGLADRGVTIRLADPGPRAAAPGAHQANRPSIIPRLHYAPSRPSRALGLVAFLNGIPVAIAEVAGGPGATARHAAERYGHGDPREPLLRGRALVRLALGPDGVLVSTRGDPSGFVPLTDGGSLLPGREFWAPGLWLRAAELLR
jgi:type I restriction enzyme, R subunit